MAHYVAACGIKTAVRQNGVHEEALAHCWSRLCYKNICKKWLLCVSVSEITAISVAFCYSSIPNTIYHCFCAEQCDRPHNATQSVNDMKCQQEL